MKKLSCIFALFLMALILVPCSDSASVESCGQETHFHDHEEHSGHHNVDLCSPFCTCSCCGSTYLIKARFFPGHEQLTFNIFNTPYPGQQSREYIDKVFQPPRA